jgi:DNA-binding Xre family transcriptional regulator
MTLNASEPSPRLTEQVAEEIRALLARRRMSGRELARQLSASPSWVNFRLTGAQPISLDDLERFAAVLGVEVSDLLPRPNEGRVVATGGTAGHAPIHSSVRMPVRSRRRVKQMSPERLQRITHPNGRTQSGPAGSAPPEPPTQRRPALIRAAGRPIPPPHAA